MELCIDTFFVNGMLFLTTTVTWVPSKQMSVYSSVLEKVLGLYMAAGFQVAQISCIRGFKPLIDEMKDEFGFTPNYAIA